MSAPPPDGDDCGGYDPMTDPSVASVLRVGPPYTDHDCPACERGEETVTPPHSSVVGSLPFHRPSGNVCTKYIAPEMLAALKKGKTIFIED